MLKKSWSSAAALGFILSCSTLPVFAEQVPGEASYSMRHWIGWLSTSRYASPVCTTNVFESPLLVQIIDELQADTGLCECSVTVQMAAI